MKKNLQALDRASGLLAERLGSLIELLEIVENQGGQLADDLGGGVSQQVFSAFVENNDRAVLVGGHDRHVSG